ncbi:hypothetical protein [Baaleninema simplex]|nr:hypothetical protein [Baaleninema simplex]
METQFELKLSVRLIRSVPELGRFAPIVSGGGSDATSPVRTR